MPTSDFSVVYDAHVRQVYAFFAYRLAVRGDAEDLTQLTFERALRAWDRYDESRASVATWLLTIARNLVIDHYRSCRPGPQRSLNDFQGDFDEHLAVWDKPNMGLDPDVELALAKLSDRERELISLRFGGDLSGREIATLTGLSLANVQQILSRALRRMRAGLDDAQEPKTPRFRRTRVATL
jgi:RNA polymerase sigma-70 factor (ECF subfamily)